MQKNQEDESRSPTLYAFDIYQNGQEAITENRRTAGKEDRQSVFYEFCIKEGMSFRYYKNNFVEEGSIIIDVLNPFLLISYTISGNKSYQVENEGTVIADLKTREYNYLFLSNQKIHCKWEAKDPIETFEIGISPELMRRFLHDDNPLYSAFAKCLENNITARVSKYNPLINPRTKNILYDMLHCPLDGYYKQLYMYAKIGELIAIQFDEYEQQININNNPSAQSRKLKKEEIERMYHARDIVLSNMYTPCSLIDIAHQVGTNDAYLKKHFKEVFGTTVFGYLHVNKMSEARRMLLEGKNVSEVAYRVGYKHVSHFTRAFKKHFGIAPNELKK